MAGWVMHVTILQSLVTGFTGMRFNSALCFVFFGMALLLAQNQIHQYYNFWFLTTVIFGTLIGLITLFQDLFHFNTGLDQFFVKDGTVPSQEVPNPGRMAFNAAFSFVLLGIGFLSLSINKRLFVLTSQYLFHVIAILAAIALIGYLYGVSIFNIIFYGTSMPPQTAALFFILSIAASLLNESAGLPKFFSDRLVGNQMAKRLFTLMALMVILVGVIRIQTNHYRVFASLDIGVSLLAVGFLLVSFMLIWNTASWLNKIDKQRLKTEGDIIQLNAELEKRVEERTIEFRNSEEKYHSLIEQASDAIYILDTNANFTDVNASMCRMTGYSPEELLQMNLASIIDPDELQTDPVPKSLSTVFRERRFKNKNGLVFDVEINAKFFSDDRVMVIARDITDRKIMETELKEAELKFRTIAEKSMVGVYIVQDGRFVYVNPRFAEVFGYEPAELIGFSAVDHIINESHRRIVAENIRRRMEGEVESINYEVLGRKKDGTPAWVEFYGSRAIIGQKATIIGSMIDIDKRKNAEDLILKEKTLSDKIINSLPGVFYLYNDKYEFLRWNKNFELFTGYTADEISEIHASDIIAEEDHDKIETAMEKAINFGYAMTEARALTKSGNKIPFLFTGTPIIYENQRCLLGTGIDISSRIAAEEELRASELKYKMLFENNPLPLWMVAKDDFSIIAANEAAAKLYGYTRDEMLKMSSHDFRHKDDYEQQMEGYRQTADSSTELNIVRHLKKDGTIMFIKLVVTDIIFGGRPVRLSLTNDVTEKLLAEESLQKSEANLQTILNTTDTAYALCDTELKIQAFNQKAVQFVKSQFGRVPVKGDRLADNFPQGNSPRFINFTVEVLKGNNINYEIDYPQADGSVLWYYVRLFPITNDHKEILGMLMALYDITQRKNAEQDLKNAYERIQSHINSIQDMAWKQSHLIRGPLANLKGLIEILQENPADSQVFEHMRNELDRMDSIIIEMAAEASDYE